MLGAQIGLPIGELALKRLQRGLAGLGELQKRGSTMIGIGLVTRPARLDELVGEALDALTLHAETPGQLRHRAPQSDGRRQYTPRGTGGAGAARHLFAELRHLLDQFLRRVQNTTYRFLHDMIMSN